MAGNSCGLQSGIAPIVLTLAPSRVSSSSLHCQLCVKIRLLREIYMLPEEVLDLLNMPVSEIRQVQREQVLSSNKAFVLDNCHNSYWLFPRKISQNNY